MRLTLLRTTRCAALLIACALWAPSGWAGALNYCQGQAQANAAAQDQLIQVAAVVKEMLQASGQSMALVARSGLALQRLDQRYSHAGISLKANPNAPWAVRQLYFDCSEQRPRIFDQGMSGFVLGANDTTEGYISMVWLPEAPAAMLERTALDKHQSLQLLGDSYSANAYAFSQRYQNCNQWLAELMAMAWGQLDPAGDIRAQAQAWLRSQAYEPTVLRVGWQPLMWLADRLPWLHSDDHPTVDLEAAQFRVSMPASIESFVRARWPDATRTELCYTGRHIVIRHGWEPVAEGCRPAQGDEVIPLPLQGIRETQATQQ